MVFNKNIKKLGKTKLINGLVHTSGTATIYYSKKNKVFARTISMGSAISVDSYAEISGSEVLPISEDFKILRTGETLAVYEQV